MRKQQHFSWLSFIFLCGFLQTAQDPLFHSGYLYLGYAKLMGDLHLGHVLKIPHIDQPPLLCLQSSQYLFQKNPVQYFFLPVSFSGSLSIREISVPSP